MSSKSEIFRKLNDMNVSQIINWIITNVSTDKILECLKNIDPQFYQTFLQQKQNSKLAIQGIDRFPINYPVQPDSLDDIMMYVEHISRGTKLVPLAVLPVPMVDTGMFESIQCDFTEEMKDISDREHKNQFIIERLSEKAQSIASKIQMSPKLFHQDYNGRVFTVLFVKIAENCSWVSGVVQTESLTGFEKIVKKNRTDCKTLTNEKEYLFHGEATDMIGNFLFTLCKIQEFGKQFGKSINLGIGEFKPYNGKMTSRSFEVKFKDIKEIKKVYNSVNKGFLNTIYDVELFLIPYSRSIAYTPDGFSNGYYHIYSGRFYPENVDGLLKEDCVDGKCSIHNSSCALLAYDAKRKGGQYLVKFHDKKGKASYKWVTKSYIKSNCECQDASGIKSLNPLMETQAMNNIEKYEDRPPFHTRVFGKYASGPYWKENEGIDLRSFQVDEWSPKGVPSKPVKVSARQGRLEDQTGSSSSEVSVNPHLPRRMSGVEQELKPGTFAAADESALKKGQEVVDKVSKCMTEDGFDMEDEDYDGPRSAFGRRRDPMARLQRKAAFGNVYLMGAQFGQKSSSFLTMVFDPKNKKWATDRSGRPKAEWVSEKKLVNLINKGRSARVSKEATQNFMKLGDFQIPQQHFTKMNVQLNPLGPLNFGYVRKALRQINKENKGFQLYPLGKGAYLKGRHAGVSATYSQQDSERLGLWPKPRPLPRMVPNSQFQFGIRRPAGSCFGKSRVNDWSRNKIINGYTGRPMAGIADMEYGYNGSQGVYGGVTGVVGSGGYSDLTIQQGLIPLKTTRFGRKTTRTRKSTKKTTRTRKSTKKTTKRQSTKKVSRTRR